MEYQLRNFFGVDVPSMLTGSSVYGFYTPQDVDYLIPRWEPEWAEMLDKAEWRSNALGEEYQGSFSSYKRHQVNLIFSNSQDYISGWENAHQFLLKYPNWGREKSDRILVFQHFRNEPTDFKLSAFLKLIELEQRLEP